MSKLEWHEVGDGVWLARTARRDARFRINTRVGGTIFDVRRFVIGGMSYLGSATSLEHAREIAEANYRQPRASDRIAPTSNFLRAQMQPLSLVRPTTG